MAYKYNPFTRKNDLYGDSSGSAGPFVPYTGATLDVDLGIYSLGSGPTNYRAVIGDDGIAAGYFSSGAGYLSILGNGQGFLEAFDGAFTLDLMKNSIGLTLSASPWTVKLNDQDAYNAGSFTNGSTQTVTFMKYLGKALDVVGEINTDALTASGVVSLTGATNAVQLNVKANASQTVANNLAQFQKSDSTNILTIAGALQNDNSLGVVTIWDKGLAMSTTGSLLSLHADDQSPFLMKLYNDTFSATTPVFTYFAWNTGKVEMVTAGWQLGIATSVNNGLLTLYDLGMVVGSGALISAHADDQSPFLLKLYNDTYSSTVPVYTYYAYNTGNFEESVPVTRTSVVAVDNVWRTAGKNRAVKSSAVSASAPTTLTDAYYLNIGGAEYNANSFRLIGLGYNNMSTDVNYPAYIGYKEISAAGKTYGDLIFATRSVTTDTTPSVRLKIDYNGDFTFGSGAAGKDYVFTVDGETNDGILTWMEDEDYFKFSDDILMDSTEAIYFRDTAIHIASLTDGHLDLTADVSIDLNGSSYVDGDMTFNSKDLEGIRYLNIGTTAQDFKFYLLDGSNYVSWAGYGMYFYNADKYSAIWTNSASGDGVYLSYVSGATHYSINAFGNAYFGLDVSAASFTDRTPAWTGTSEEALDQLTRMSSSGGQIDHTTLPAFTRRKVKDPKTGADIEGRDLGATITMLVESVKELKRKLNLLETK